MISPSSQQAARTILLLTGLTCRATSCLMTQQAQQTTQDTTILVTLGTGIPRPNPDASGPSTAVVVGDKVLLTHLHSDDELLAGIRKGRFTGQVVVGHDLGKY